MKDINKISKEELMDEYIKKEEAILAFDDNRVERYYGDVSPESVIEVIKNIPAADVRPVVRGQLMYKEITSDFHIIGQCSVCKERRRIDNYCPNCGADMREEN